MKTDLTSAYVLANNGLAGGNHPAGQIMPISDITTSGSGGALTAHFGDILANSVTVSVVW
jgi:hypothetical protein